MKSKEQEKEDQIKLKIQEEKVLLKKKKDEEKIQKLRDKGIVQRESRRRPTRNNVNYGTIDHELEEALAQSALMYHDGEESSTSSSSSSSMVCKSKSDAGAM